MFNPLPVSVWLFSLCFISSSPVLVPAPRAGHLLLVSVSGAPLWIIFSPTPPQTPGQT